MWIDYADKITESADELRALEKKRSAERSVAGSLEDASPAEKRAVP
jgi:hypothetical protein